jgi:mRNA-degrading endonuclease RelE of RelBE toxin-antitoxin system
MQIAYTNAARKGLKKMPAKERAIFEVEDGVLVIRVAHRREVYK